MYSVVTHNEFTDNESVNKAVLGLSIIRLFIFFCIFTLTLNQFIHEFIYAKSKNKFLSPRLFTFGSLTIYTGLRVVMISVFFYDKTVDNGSYSAAISIWGTCFQYFEWVFICVMWICLLKNFFKSSSTPSATQDELMKNIKSLWIFAFIIVSILISWTIVNTIFNFYNVKLMNKIYGPGQIVIVVGIGGFFLTNGIILAGQIKKFNNPILNKLFGRIVKMSLALLVMVIGVFVVTIIIFVIGIDDYDKRYYGFYIILCLLEFFQLSIVMYSLGRDSFKGYFAFRRIGDTNSSSNTPPSKNNNSNNSNNASIKLNSLPIGDNNV